MTDPLATLLRQTDPYAGHDATPETLTAASVALASEVVDADRLAQARARSTRRRRRIGFAAVAASLAVPATAWASYHFAAQSGWFGAPGMTENDTSEWINVCAADFPDYFATLPRPTDAAPEGLTWAQIGTRIVEQKRIGNAKDCAGAGVMEQSTGLKSSYYLYAENVWTCRAVAAHRSGDDAAFRANAASAATMMDRLSAMGIYGDDNWKPIREGLRSGDFSVINKYYDVNNSGTGACA